MSVSELMAESSNIPVWLAKGVLIAAWATLILCPIALLLSKIFGKDR